MSIPYSGQISMGQVAREQCKPLLNVKMRDISSFAGYVIKDSMAEFYGYNRVYPSVSGIFSPALSGLAMTKISGMTGIWGTGQITYTGSTNLNLVLKWYASGQSSYPTSPELNSPWASAYATQLNLSPGQAFTLMSGYINTAETAISVNPRGFTCGESYPAAIGTQGTVAAPPDTTTQNSFVFDADYIILTYQFNDGQDLDIKVRVANPDIGQNTVAKYIGYPGTADHIDVWPQSGRPILQWGGDNTGTGLESVLIDVVAFQLAYPTTSKIVVDLRASWFVAVGVNPVSVIAKMYTGGTVAANAQRNFTCTGFSNSSTINSVSKVITTTYTTNGNAERLATLTYDISTGLGTFNTNDTTTPTV
jgi:hypothetical protein